MYVCTDTSSVTYTKTEYFLFPDCHTGASSELTVAFLTHELVLITTALDAPLEVVDGERSDAV